MTYVVIFRSKRSENHPDLYYELNHDLAEKIQGIPGYLGHSSARDPESRQGVTVVYFDSLAAIDLWRKDTDHQHAKSFAKSHFYENYSVEIARVEDSYSWPGSTPA